MAMDVARPRFREAEAEALAAELYGLTAAARPLASERDQNFLMTTTAGEAWVLKLARAGERREELELQNAALEWVRAKDPSLPLPAVRPTLAGESLTRVRAAAGAEHYVRLLTYLPGTVLAHVKPHTPDLVRGLGRLLGRLDRDLEGFAHPAGVGRDFEWDPARLPEVVARNQAAVADPERRALVAHFAALFDSLAAPVLPSLRAGVIHNDANDHNVLVGPPALEAREIAGLVDFGDLVHAPTVWEPAVAAAYAMLDKADPVAAGAWLLAGYHQAHPLSDAELAVVFPLVCLRLCASVCLSARRRREEPDNAYLTVSEAPAWRVLEALRPLSPRLAEYRFRGACGRTPCPEGPRVSAWLRDHAAELAGVLDLDLGRAPVLDLNVGSPDLPSPAAAADMRFLERHVQERMHEAGAQAALGRYDEARLVYASDAFRGASGGDEWRTVHLGLDVFARAGTAVRAPLAGRVHSVENNAAPYDYGPTLILEHEPAGGPVFYTLYGHLTEDSIAGIEAGTAVARGQVVGRIGAPPGNGDWPPHLHLQVVADLVGWRGDFPGVAPASQREVWLSLCPDPSPLLKLPAESVAGPGPDPAQLAERRRRLLGPSLSVSYRSPLLIVRGFGAQLYDATGQAYLDAVNNVAHVGHGHPRVVHAARAQAPVLNTNTRYLHETILRYAERLTATLPEPLRVCFFVNSGSEANELALRLARARTGGRDFVVVDGAYHGHTSALIEVSPYKFAGAGGEGRPAHVRVVPMPDDYRGLYRRDDRRRGERFADHVRLACEGIREAGRRPAGFLCESLLSCGGQIVLPPGYLAAAYRHARAVGAVCIADEVQVGFGRVGSHVWGFETQGVVPDIVTMGKPIGNGHPLGAVVTTPEIAAAFANGMEYFNTFGGNPVSCAVGLAVLDVMEDEGLQARAREVGGRLAAGLEGLKERHAVVGDVRGLGLFLGIELVEDRDSRVPAAAPARYVVERMKERGVLLSTDGPDHNVIKIKPPLAFGLADADRMVGTLDAVLAEDFVRR